MATIHKQGIYRIGIIYSSKNWLVPLYPTHPLMSPACAHPTLNHFILIHSAG